MESPPLREFLRRQQNGNLPLPKGCYANYELGVIDFLNEVIKTLPKGIVGYLRAAEVSGAAAAECG